MRRGPRLLTRLHLPSGEASATMLGGDEFISSPPRKTVRFGGTLTDILLKYEKVTGCSARAAPPRPGYVRCRGAGSRGVIPCLRLAQDRV